MNGINEIASDGLSGIVSGLSFAQASKKSKQNNISKFRTGNNTNDSYDDAKNNIRLKFRLARKKRIAEMLDVLEGTSDKFALEREWNYKEPDYLQYHIKKNDKKIGNLSGSKRNKDLYIHYMGARNDPKSSDDEDNSIGIHGAKQILHHLKREHPDIEAISGDRISGVKKGEHSFKIPKIKEVSESEAIAFLELLFEDSTSDKDNSKKRDFPNAFSSTDQLKANQDFYASLLRQKTGMAVRYPWVSPANSPSSQPKTSDPKEQNTESGKFKKNKERRTRLKEALAYGERDPTQKRLRSQDNTPGNEIGVKVSQAVPTRDLNDESGTSSLLGGINNFLKKKKKIKEDYIIDLMVDYLNKKGENACVFQQLDEVWYSDWYKYLKNLLRTPKEKPEEKPEEIKDSGKDYIWRTQQDDKVRDLHRELEGKTFNMDDPPVSGTSGFKGNPGEPANCRCYAEPV
jgi:SPP1 gp7 family putative phage head morphogenesis protein